MRRDLRFRYAHGPGLTCAVVDEVCGMATALNLDSLVGTYFQTRAALCAAFVDLIVTFEIDNRSRGTNLKTGAADDAIFCDDI